MFLRLFLDEPLSVHQPRSSHAGVPARRVKSGEKALGLTYGRFGAPIILKEMTRMMELQLERSGLVRGRRSGMNMRSVLLLGLLLAGCGEVVANESRDGSVGESVQGFSSSAGARQTSSTIMTSTVNSSSRSRTGASDSNSSSRSKASASESSSGRVLADAATDCSAPPPTGGQQACALCEGKWYCTLGGAFPPCPDGFDGGTPCSYPDQCIVCNSDDTSTVWTCHSSENWDPAKTLNVCLP